jgi:HlyD family secretion protein
MKHLTRKMVVGLVVATVVVLAVMWYIRNGSGNDVSFRTVPIKRGDILATIGATGTVEPEELVDVGAQVAGQINTFGKDKDGNEVDYGSAVEEGTILAQIDDTVYASSVAMAQAQWENAKAGVQRAQADLEQMKAKLDQAQRDWERAQKLGSSEALAQTSYDAYKAAFETAKANVAVGEAVIVQAKASVDEAKATLDGALRNLSYCTIKSPVKGVIIDRRVNIGQTVVSSLSAPSLFLIAKDLRRMQVWVSVNEADIGQIFPGQPVTFTVDAYPGIEFKGEVGKVRLNATMTQNVVTYTVEVTTDNSSGKLLPYLTANVQFELSRRENVLTVPNSALRWSPQPEQVAEQFRTVPASTTDNSSSGTRHKAKDSNSPAGDKQRILWVKDGSYARPVKVSVGMTDGTMTEVQGNDLKEGLEVIIGEQEKSAAAGTGTVNPFTPQRPRPTARPSSGQPVR